MALAAQAIAEPALEDAGGVCNDIESIFIYISLDRVRVQ